MNYKTNASPAARVALWVAHGLAAWPLWLLHGLGWGLGWLVWLTAPLYRQRWRAHTRLAGLSAAQARASIGAAGQQVLELPKVWFGPRLRYTFDGAQHIEAALADGGGLLFLTPHMGCFEATSRAYAETFGAAAPMTVLYRPPRQAWLHPLLHRARQRPHLEPASTSMTGVKQMLTALRQQHAVGLLPDQVPPAGLGVWSPFWGQPAYTMTLAPKLAQQARHVLLAWGERLPAGRGYVIHVRPAEPPLPANAEAAAGQLNAWMEALIQRCPAQYAWGYARFKPPRG
ncbi:MAG: lysophospholipid acyltransferase family protein [Burkholderiaceae bacterium]